MGCLEEGKQSFNECQGVIQELRGGGGGGQSCLEMNVGGGHQVVL